MLRLWTAILILALVPALAVAQPKAKSVLKKTGVTNMATNDGPWSSLIRYSIVSDFADNRSPRGYTHAALGTLAYNFTKEWSLEATVGGRAELIDGQISKGREQTYDETLGPSTSLALGFEQKFLDDDQWSVYLDGEPLWDEASRQEGYKGIVGIGGNVSLRFFNKRWIVSNDLSLAELINTYEYGSSLKPNPGHFYTYKLSNVVKIYRGFRATYSFGAKITQYLDGFTGYNYSNSFSLSYVWPHVSVALAYDNGGFTDDGTISLWYLDQYRRLGRFVVGYTF